MVFLALMACILVGVAAYNLTCAFVDVPTSKTSKMMMFAKKQQGIRSEKLHEVYITKIATKLAPFIHLDKLKRRFIFEGYGREKGMDPAYRIFYRVNFDGSGLTLLTPGNGYHSIELSKQGNYLLDVYSRVDMIGSICTLLSRGALISMIVVIFILPAMFMLFDKLIVKTSIGFLGKKKKAAN